MTLGLCNLFPRAVTASLAFLSLSTALWSRPVEATEEAEQVQRLLSNMSQAIRELSYRGLFTYEQGSSLDTLKIVHTVRDGVEYERLQHLNGPEREFLRSGQSVECLPLSDQLLRGRLLSIGDKVRGLAAYYHFYIRDQERIAGRKATVVQIMPKDNLRYGYTIGIDVETGLPLKSLLVSNRQQILERFQFVELVVGAVDDQDLQPVYRKHRVAGHQLSDCSRITQSSPSHWEAAWIPNGFMFTGQRKTDNQGDMLMFTDGLTAFSVFVDPIVDKILLEGTASRGGTVAIMSRVTKHKTAYSVTVVGEIPTATAQRVASSIRSIP